MDDIQTPIDVVYTWVDGSDPKHRAKRLYWLEQLARSGSEGQFSDQDFAPTQFIDHDELRFSVRSVERFAPWVRQIFLVTDGQSPSWLQSDHPRIRLIDHREIFPNPEHLPTFSSTAIECHLHHISGLSEFFLYFNDDCFLGRQLSPTDFCKDNKARIPLQTAGGKKRLIRTLRHALYALTMNRSDESRQLAVPNLYTYQEVATIPERNPNCPTHFFMLRNTLELLQTLFGIRPFFLPTHCAKILRRSAMFALEDMFPRQVEQTSASKFRSKIGINFTYLCQTYLLETGQGLVSPLKTGYFTNSSSVPSWEFALLMYRIRAQEFPLFCFNDVEPNPEQWRFDKFKQTMNYLLAQPSSVRNAGSA